MADANSRPMKEFAPPVVETSPSCILLDAIARNYELKSIHYNMLPSFYGVVATFYASIMLSMLYSSSSVKLFQYYSSPSTSSTSLSLSSFTL